MKILAVVGLKEGVAHKDTLPYQEAESQMVWEQYTQGVIREIYVRGDAPGVVNVMECKDVAEADNYLQRFPMFKAGLLTAQIIPLEPFKLWEVLFKNNSQNETSQRSSSSDK